jgi:hypothetical protein
MPSPDFEKVIDQTRTFLSDMEKSLISNKDPARLSHLVGDFYEFYEEWEMFNVKFSDEFKTPEDIPIKIKYILKSIRAILLGDKQILWEEYVQEGMDVLRRIKNNLPADCTSNQKFLKDRHRFIGKTIQHILEITDAIEDYEQRFHEKFNPSMCSDLNMLIRAMENKVKSKFIIEAQDKNLVSIQVDTITSDKLLDLYEEIKRISGNTKEKRKKKELLKIWTKIFNEENKV